MLRAIGGRRATIVGDMLAEAAILGLIGGAIGSAMGIVAGRIAIGRLPPAVTQGLEARVEYWLPGYAIPLALAATALTSVARVGHGGTAGVQGFTDRGAGAGRGFARRTSCRDGCESRSWGWGRRGVRGVDLVVVGQRGSHRRSSRWPSCCAPRSRSASRSPRPSSKRRRRRRACSDRSGRSRRRRSNARRDECGRP